MSNTLSLQFDQGIKVQKVVEAVTKTVTPKTVIIDLIALQMQIYTEEGGQEPVRVALTAADVAHLLPRVAKVANNHFARLAKDDAAEQKRRAPAKRARKAKPKGKP